MNLFLCKHVDLETAQALSTSSFVQPPATPSASNTRCAAFTSPECIVLTSAKRSTAALMRQLDEVKEELASERQKNKTLSDISVKCHEDIRNMQGMLENVDREHVSATEDFTAETATPKHQRHSEEKSALQLLQKAET